MNHCAALCGAILLSVILAAPVAGAGIELPQEEVNQPVSIRATEASHWKQGSYDVYALRGQVEVRQGSTVASAPEAVLWIDRAEPYTGRASKVIAYLEGPRNSVRVDVGRSGAQHTQGGRAAQSLVDRTWLGWFYTEAGIELSVPVPTEEPSVKPAIFERGLDARDPSNFGVQPAQLRQEELAAPVGQPAPPTGRRVRFVPRSGGRMNFSTEVDNAANERIVTGTSGVQILIDGLDQLGSVAIETDRFVVWTANTGLTTPTGQQMDLNDGPLELYLEGNIVFRQGDRIIYADRLYYNVRQEFGVVLEAEMLTPVPQYQGLLRLKADVLQQVNRQQFRAYNSALTSSRIGVPRYWLQSEDINVIDMQRQPIDPVTGLPAVNPANGQPAVEHRLLATARNNYIYLFETPVFYWPVIATDLTSPTYYLENIKVNSDQVFGQQLLLDWDLYQLLGIQEPPQNSKWTLSTDYLSQRGLALGTTYRYESENFFGLPGPYKGYFDAWGLKDDGTDNLGRDRRVIVPEKDWRGRAILNHRQYLPNEFVLTAELGWISDRNFLEQYYELEWDTLKDEDTGIELKQYNDNTSWSVAADVQLNAFFTKTQGARLDHFWMGQSLLFDRLTWYEHSSVGYADMKAASTPTNPVDLAKFQLLPYERNVSGPKAFTRQEIDAPVELGPVKFTPYLLGEAAYWGSDLNDESISRVYGQGGIRAALPMWTADQSVCSELFNLNGLAHKVTWEAEYFYAQSNQNVDLLPMYDALDDDSTEAFRRRMLFNTFGLTFGDQIPKQFDARYFALRQGLQSSVASPVTEIADDLTELRLGVKQRWQTKRGLPGQERIVDWIVLDIDAVLFPQADRDNFGENLGMIDYDFQWHVGDRLTFLSDGFFDIFDQGIRQVTVGALLSRPESGNVYLAMRSTEGPISSNVLAASTSYRMSEKWIATAGASIDFSKAGNLGQNVAFTRVGESFLIKVGVNYDASRDNFGVSFGLEPRFLPSSRLGRVGGVQVPPAGALGLE
ncbi:organic solvent tolerance protein OstA [Anatilimnocola sp. NA78]|uniref:organic solvent tolerance protein OstA n=1 Tax=Anatilimnocola sp. NA78 TaxID=3415683 RepID=UPI003CE4F6A7